MSEEAIRQSGGLILVDIDQVLAMYRGGDCQVGFPIYRTCKEVPKFPQDTDGREVALAIVTHRARREALCILEAIGLTACFRHIISANDLLRESIRRVVRERRMEGLSKSVVGSILRRKFGIYDSRRTVMIDDKLDNLIRMLRARVIGFGLLTPKITRDDAGRVRAFDIQSVLGTAAVLAGATTYPSPVRGIPPIRANYPELLRDTAQSRSGGYGPEHILACPQPLPPAPAIFTFPLMTETWPESDLDTGRVLCGSPFTPVTVLRGCKRQVTKILR